MTKTPLFAALTAAGLALAAATAASAAPHQCFRMSQMHGWKATPDARAFYMRVNMNEIYRVDLAGTCPRLRSPAVHLVTKLSNDLVCSPVEFDLSVADNSMPSFPSPCIVSEFRKLSPAEAAALPRNLRP